MAWPPPTQVTVDNSTVQFETHKDLHNATKELRDETVTKVAAMDAQEVERNTQFLLGNDTTSTRIIPNWNQFLSLRTDRSIESKLRSGTNVGGGQVSATDMNAIRVTADKTLSTSWSTVSGMAFTFTQAHRELTNYMAIATFDFSLTPNAAFSSAQGKILMNGSEYPSHAIFGADSAGAGILRNTVTIVAFYQINNGSAAFTCQVQRSTQSSAGQLHKDHSQLMVLRVAN